MNQKLLLAACAVFSFSNLAHAGAEGWSDDFEASAKIAAEENKDMLVNFTGSDWCGWCIRLAKEVFSHDEFKTGVKDGYVLVELDYPQDKSILSEETIKQNQELQGKYSVQGFPTILLLDGEGRPFAQTGYQEGGPVKYVAHLKELSALRASRDEAFENAEKLEGVEKAKALVTALQAIKISEPLVAEFYGEQIEAIKAADPADESGFVKGIETKKKFGEFEQKINQLAGGGDFKAALEYTDETIANGGFEGEQAQQILTTKGMIHIQLEEIEKGFEALNKAEAIDPDGDFGKRINMLKGQIKQKLSEDAAAKAAGEEEAEEE